MRADIASAIIPGAGLAGPLNLLTVEPRVPRVAGTPCVVDLFTNLPFDNNRPRDGAPYRDFAYVPPAGCPGPWVKVILKMAFSGPGNSDLANMSVALDDGTGFKNRSVTLFFGSPQINDRAAVWRVERDVTDYSTLLTTPRKGFASYSDFYFLPELAGGTAAIGTAQLLFYPATAQVPAPSVPDAIVTYAMLPLPRNMERVYLDVYPQVISWLTCLPLGTHIEHPILNNPMAMGYGVEEGCIGDGYLEVMVTIDQVPVSVAPIFPWLHSDAHPLFRRTVDVPVPAAQALNFMPYRVDLTPFAALLNDGLDHSIGLTYFDATGEAFSLFRRTDIEANLLLYLDHGSQQLTGAVTRNTLESQTDVGTVEPMWTQEGDVLQGGVMTRRNRVFESAGYLDTSQGRIFSTVQQASWFWNIRSIRVDGVSHPEQHTYSNAVQMASTTHKTSTRRLGSSYLSIDRERHRYPFKLQWQATGGSVLLQMPQPHYVTHLNLASLMVTQDRQLDTQHSRPGRPTYAAALAERFSGSHRLNFDTGVNTNWKSSRTYAFDDNAGSCYRAALTTFFSVLHASQAGIGCPGDENRVVWFAHPDGSPSNLLWVK